MKKMFLVILTLALMCSLFSTQLVGFAASADKDRFKGQSITYYGRWMEQDEKWLLDNIIDPFEKEYGVSVTVRNAENLGDIVDIIKLDETTKSIGLILTAIEIEAALAQTGLLLPVETYAEPEFIANFDLEALPTKQDDVLYFLPNEISAYLLTYQNSKVEDVINNWEGVREAVDASLKEFNGYGLPEEYVFETDPNNWNNYDLAVAGWYWANTEYDGKTAPRIAHRGKNYDGTANELANKVYQMGGTADDILIMDNQAVIDAYAWENYYAQAGIYVPAMWEEAWTGGGIYNGFSDGSCFLAFMHIADQFTIHGTGTPDLPGYMVDPDDLRQAVMPSGASLEIQDGKPARVSEDHASVSFGFVHAIPSTTPNVELSYELLKWMMQPEYLAHWAQTGRLTPNKTLTANLSDLIEEPWVRDIYDVMDRQIPSAKPVPMVIQWPEVGIIYCDAWTQVMTEKPATVDEVIKAHAVKVADAMK